MLGEWSGKILSTPTPYEIFRTVKVEREPFETRRMHTPSNAWRRVFSPSRIFAQTLIESPGRNSGSATVRRWLLSIESRIRWAVILSSGEKAEWTQGSTGDPLVPSRHDAEESVEQHRARRANREMIPLRGSLDRRKHAG